MAARILAAVEAYSFGDMDSWTLGLELSARPMIEMLAAGGRLIVKPSDDTPAFAALL